MSSKCKLLSELEKQATSSDRIQSIQEEECAWVIDGMAILQMVKPTDVKTFGHLSELILGIVLRPLREKSCSRVDVTFDRYDEPLSIKAGERAQRHKSATNNNIVIAKEQLQIPKKFGTYMSESANKAALANFLS